MLYPELHTLTSPPRTRSDRLFLKIQKSSGFIHATVEDKLDLPNFNLILLDKVQSQPTLSSQIVLSYNTGIYSSSLVNDMPLYLLDNNLQCGKLCTLE